MSNKTKRVPALEALTGGTPLVPLAQMSRRCGHRILAKCEFLNPNGSLKDRIALGMIDAAEAAGVLQPGRSTIVEATGGNTGLALAALAAVRGYGLVITISSKIGPEKIELMRDWGAEVVICPYEVPPESEDHFIRIARRIARERPHHWFIDQFSNAANVEAHYRTTAPEIWEQAGNHVDAVVCGVGTGGTLMGLARFARERGARCRFVLADPEGSILAAATRGEAGQAHGYRVEGIGGDFLPPLFDPTAVTDAFTVPDAVSFQACRRLAAEEGLFAGLSSGCVLAAASAFTADLMPAGQTVVVVLGDSGRNYSSKIAPVTERGEAA